MLPVILPSSLKKNLMNVNITYQLQCSIKVSIPTQLGRMKNGHQNYIESDLNAKVVAGHTFRTLAPYT
jgi:hypothetical protein